MDPNDLLFLHSTLARSIRALQAENEQLQAEIGRLKAQLPQDSESPQED